MDAGPKTHSRARSWLLTLVALTVLVAAAVSYMVKGPHGRLELAVPDTAPAQPRSNLLGSWRITVT